MASKRIPQNRRDKKCNTKHFFLFVNDVTKFNPSANDTRKMEEIVARSKQKL